MDIGNFFSPFGIPSSAYDVLAKRQHGCKVFIIALMPSAPYLSIIVTGRNDNYGGDFASRLQNSVRWWSHYIKEYQIPAEYIFVNWNPLPDVPSLRDTIQWAANEFFEVRFVEVPDEIHRQFDNAAIRKPNELYEFIAKNAGIRRAAGDYILSTNADILCDPKIFEFIAQRKLSPEAFYRADRYDFRKIDDCHADSSRLLREPVEAFEEKLEQIRKNVFEIKGFGKTFPFHYNGNMEASIRKFKKENARYLRWNLFKRKYEKFFVYLKMNIDYDNAEYHTHVNASGDFTLMHRTQWHALRAYSEKFRMTMHNDSELMFNAHASGLKQEIFFYPVYHQDHERRYSDENPALQREAYQLYKELQAKAQRLLQTHQPEIENDEDWGLKNFDLEVKRVSLTG